MCHNHFQILCNFHFIVHCMTVLYLSTTELTVCLCMQKWRYSSTHVKFGTRFMPQPFYPCFHWREPGWAQSQCGRCKYQSTVPARSLVTTATELPLPRPCLKAQQCDRTQCHPSAVEWAGPSIEDWMAWLLCIMFCCVVVSKFLIRTVCCR